MSKKRFVIVPNTDTMAREDEDRLTKFLREDGWEVWHWFSSLWLITGNDAEATVESIARRIRTSVAMSQFVVFEAPPETRGFGINLPRASTEWLQKKWPIPSETVPA